MRQLKNLTIKLKRQGAVALNKGELNLLAELFTAFKKRKRKPNSTTQLFYRIASRIKRHTKYHLWKDEWLAFLSVIKIGTASARKPVNRRNSYSLVNLLVGISFSLGAILIASYLIF